MGPKVAAACNFVQGGGAFAAIGSIDDAPDLLVIQQQVNKLGHFDVVNLDWG